MAKPLNSRLKTSSDDDWRILRRPPTHPGAYLQTEVLDEYGLTHQELADRLDISRLSVSEILNGKRPVTESTALRLWKLTNIPPEFWLDTQQTYDLWTTYRAQADLLSRIRRLRPKRRTAVRRRWK